MPIWGQKPELERKKAIAPYVQSPKPSPGESKFYLLARAAEVITPMGYVDAKAGDILHVTNNGLWVLAAEVLNAFGVIVKPL